MNEVAKLLGVRIGEDFEIDTKEGKFVFDNKGLYSMHTKAYSPYILFQLLTGELSIKPQPWKPTLNQTYYTVDEKGGIVQDLWWGDYLDIMSYRLGNCYATELEAEQHRDKWLAFYASDKILEV